MLLFGVGTKLNILKDNMDRVKRIWYLSPMRAAKVQASLPIRAVSPEPPLLAHTSSESRGAVRQKARSLAPLNGWACAVKICNDGMLKDTNSLDRAHMRFMKDLFDRNCPWLRGRKFDHRVLKLSYSQRHLSHDMTKPTR